LLEKNGDEVWACSACLYDYGKIKRFKKFSAKTRTKKEPKSISEGVRGNE